MNKCIIALFIKHFEIEIQNTLYNIVPWSTTIFLATLLDSKILCQSCNFRDQFLLQDPIVARDREETQWVAVDIVLSRLYPWWALPPPCQQQLMQWRLAHQATIAGILCRVPCCRHLKRHNTRWRTTHRTILFSHYIVSHMDSSSNTRKTH